MTKRNFCAYLAIGLAPILSSCQPKVDVEREQEAIKAVLEEEKKGYFAKDLERMASAWAQKPSSVKIFLSQEGEVDMFGWEKIREQGKEDISKDWSAYQDMRVDFSDFQFNIYDANAWVIFKARWSWTYNNEPGKSEQTRIMAFEKAEGKWKITLMAIYALPAERKQEAR